MTVHGGRLTSNYTETNEQRATPQSLLLPGAMVEESSFMNCDLDIFLENLKLECDSETFIHLQRDIKDTDKLPDEKMVALIISSIAVGCKETAVSLGRTLQSVYEDKHICDPTQMHVPKEKELTRCDLNTLKSVETVLESNKQSMHAYLTTAPPLLYSLGCQGLANYSMNNFYKICSNKVNGSDEFNHLKQQHTKTTPIKNEIIMEYLYQHKMDAYTARNIYNLADEIVETESEILQSGHSGDHVASEIKPVKKISAGDDINASEFFKIHLKCSIVMPVGVSLQPISKLGCLQLCLNQDSCQSAGYTNDNSMECQLNTEVADEVGPSFFSCGKKESNRWDYFEKKKHITYFIISSKSEGKVIQATSDSSVEMRDYNGDENQFWFWKDKFIASKRYPDRRLTVSRYGTVLLKRSADDSEGQIWTFENDHLTTQNGQLTIDANQKWTLSLDRFYFIITSRQSGKVLDASLDNPGVVHMWSYNGGDNQYWFWDDDCIRSKKFPDKVLDLHKADYLKDNWGKVYLHPYHGGTHQRWETKGNSIISKYEGLYLDVKHGNMGDYAPVGGYPYNGYMNQWWTLGTTRMFFFILNKDNGKVIDAASHKEIKQWHYHGGNHQLWFWDGDALRNKKYADKVLDVGQNLILSSFEDKPSQRWSYRDNTLKCGDSNFSIEVRGGSKVDGAYIAAQERTAQTWSLIPEHGFFSITSRQDATVLSAGAKSTDSITLRSYAGTDSEQWFWDDDNIRSKAFPEKVLDINLDEYQVQRWGTVQLFPYNRGDNQRWIIREDELISRYKDLRLERKDATIYGSLVAGHISNGQLNQMWSLNPTDRTYFVIKGKESGKVLDAASDGNVILYDYHGGDNQLWFWDKDVLRNKKYTYKVLDLHMSNFKKDGWGKVYLHTYHGGDNQKWEINKNYIICEYKSLYLDVREHSTKNYAPVGGYHKTGNANQQWIITVHQSSCVDKTEREVYNIVQWIPFISTIWDLWSSVGYGIAGCHEVAKERAISYGIGLGMDMATIVTAGTASVGTTAIKEGFKAGIKFALKHSMKTAVKIVEGSIIRLINEATGSITEAGLKRSIMNAIKKSEKLYIQERVIDPAMFLKNVGKFSKSVLSHPIRNTKKAWKAASKAIDDLKQIKKQFDDFKITNKGFANKQATLKIRYKRGGQLVQMGYSETQESLFKQMAVHKIRSQDVETCAERYMEMNTKYVDEAAFAVKDRMNQLESLTEKAELLAVHEYTDSSADVNMIVQKILEGKSLRDITEITDVDFFSPDVNFVYNQATLIQDYLMKNPLKQPMTVYRFEYENNIVNYQHNGIYKTKRFTSTTEENKRIFDRGLKQTRETHPVELTIHLEKSGTNIADLSKFPDQKEWLIPIGTEFKVRKEIVEIDGHRITKVQLQEIVKKMNP